MELVTPLEKHGKISWQNDHKKADDRCVGEIDLLVRSREVIIFVEVRTLTSSKFAHPEETINHRKQSHILAAVEDYIPSLDIDHWQIDAIAIEGKPGSGSKPLITHFENVMG